MTFKVAGQIELNAEQAKAQLAALKKAMDTAKSGAGQLGGAGRSSGASLRQMEAAAGQLETQLTTLATAERTAAANAGEVGRAGNVAAGQMGNLVAQFNDIGMMMMAGQNPLQLAIQQGTQITQVIGPMGAGGAARALGGAFLGMLAPINLITIGAIAAGAALVQWLTSSKDEAEDLDDILSRIDENITAIREGREMTGLAGVGELIERYGRADQVVRDLVESEVSRSTEAASGDIEALFDQMQGIRDWSWRNMMTGLMSDFRAEVQRLSNDLEITGLAAARLNRAMLELEQAEGAQAQVEALGNMRRALLNATGGYKGMNAEAEELLATINAAQDRQLQFLAATKAVGSEMTIAQVRAAQYAAATRGESDAAVATAQQMLAALQSEAELQALIARHGEESLQVAEFRAAAERDIYAEKVASLDVSEALKAELMAAFDAAQGLSLTNMAATIGDAANEAERLAKNLAAARGAAVDRITRNPDFADPRNESGMGGRIIRDRPVPPQNRPGYKPPRVSTRGGGGRRRSASRAPTIDRERQAVERLLERERQQLEILRATDPVQKELIRNRDTLKSATDAERAEIEKLIGVREREKKAAEQAAEASGFWRDTIYGAFEGAIMRGENLGDVIMNMIIPALLKAALLGEGPLGGLFGGAGLIGMIIPGLATGGFVAGAGSGTSDDIPTMLSAGEYVVNAKATAQNRALLEHINSGGQIAGFARGGAVGAAPMGAAAMPTQGGGDPARLHVSLDEGLRAELRAESRQIAMAVVGEYDRYQAPGTVRRIMDNPRIEG